MSEIKVRRIEDWVVATHRRRAEAAGRSLEEELRLVLTEAALEPQHAFAARAAVLRAEIRRVRGVLADSAAVIRAERDERG